MPRVPTVDGPSVQQAALPGAYQRTEASPALLQNDQLARAGQVMEQVGARIQEVQDADEVMRAETALRSKYQEWEGEAKQRRGQNAWGLSKEAGQWVDTEAGKISDGLANPLQKRALQMSAEKLRGAAVGQFSEYEAGQRRESFVASSQASIVSSINMAAADPTNIDLQRSTKADVLARTSLQANLLGWSPEIREAKQGEYLTNFHKQVLQTLVAKSPSDAAAYFEANKAEIDGSQHAELGEFARKATATRVGEVAADAAWVAGGPKGDRDPVQLDKMEAALRERPDLKGNPEALKHAIASVRDRTSAFKDSRKERDQELEATVNAQVMRGMPSSAVQRMPEFMRMDGEAQRKLVDFMENRSLRRTQQALTTSNLDVVQEQKHQQRLQLQNAGAYMELSNPEVIAGMSENAIRAQLPRLGIQYTQNLIDKKRALSDPTKLAQAKIDDDTFKLAAQDIGFHSFAPKNEEEKGQLGMLKARVEESLAAAQQRSGKQFTQSEMRDFMRTQLANTVKTNSLFSSSEVPVIALQPGDVGRLDPKQIPNEERAQIAASMARAYKRTGAKEFEPSEANVLRLYAQRRAQGAGFTLNQPLNK